MSIDSFLREANIRLVNLALNRKLVYMVSILKEGIPCAPNSNDVIEIIEAVSGLNYPETADSLITIQTKDKTLALGNEGLPPFPKLVTLSADYTLLLKIATTEEIKKLMISKYREENYIPVRGYLAAYSLKKSATGDSLFVEGVTEQESSILIEELKRSYLEDLKILG